MAVRYSVVVQDAEGDAQTGLTVQLYNYGDTPGVDPAVATLTDNADGSYCCAVSASGKYSVAIGGTIQDELDGIYIAADDVVTDITDKADKVAAAVNGNLAGLDVNGNLTDSGLAAASTLTTSDIINTLVSTSTTDALSAAQGKALKDAADILSGKVGDADFATCVVVSSSSDITDAIQELDRQSYQNMLATTTEAATKRQLLVYGLSGASGADGWFDMPLGYDSDPGYPMGRSGSITGIYVSWTTGTVAGSDIFTITAYLNTSTASASTQILDTEIAADYHGEQFALGSYAFAAGDRIGVKWARMGSDTITNLCVMVEVTLG